MSLKALIASILAATLATPAPCGIFDNQFPDMTITAPQEKKVQEAGMSPGTGGAADVDAPPTYVAPGASTQKNIQRNQQATANESTGEGEEKKPEVPQLPSGGQGKGKESGGSGSGGGGGCKSCQKGLQDKIDAAKAKLALADKNDPHVKGLIKQAEDSIAKAEKAKGDLDAINKSLKEAHDSLEKAAGKIKEQNDKNEKALKPLEDAQPKRDALVKALDEKTPDCTGTEMKETYPSSTADAGASGDISGAESKSTAASRKLPAIDQIITFIGNAATSLGLTEAKADSKLKANDGNETEKVLEGLEDGVAKSKEASDAGVTKAQTAKKETEDAQKQSQQVAEKLASTKTEAESADKTANEACKKLKELKEPYAKAKEQSRDPKPEISIPAKIKMGEIETEASALKKKAEAENDLVKPKVKQLRTAHDKAVKQLDPKAKKAIEELKKHLEK